MEEHLLNETEDARSTEVLDVLL